MASNFNFLSAYFPAVARLGREAEEALIANSDTSALAVDALAGELLDRIAEREALDVGEMGVKDKTGVLRASGKVPDALAELLPLLSLSAEETREALEKRLQVCFLMSARWVQVYEDETFLPPIYRSLEELARATAEEEREETAPEGGGEAPCAEVRIARIDALITEVVNYSLQQNKKPIIQRLSIVNDGEVALTDLDLRITSTPAFCRPLERHVDLVPAKSSLRLKDLSLLLDASYMATLTEQEVGALHLELLSGGEALYSSDVEITCLAFDEWHGSSYYPELLASFVTPNHPEVARLAVAASDFLEKWTGDPSLDGYLSGDPNRVLSMAAAVYSALCEEGIRYAVPPASFHSVGQRVRLCDTVMRQRMGTCLDLSLLYVSVLEAIGLNPILLLTRDHAFAGVWLEDHSFPEAVQDDASLVTKRLADGVNEIAVVECTLFVAGKNAGFDLAREAAQNHLSGEAPLESIIDVKRARLSGIVSLPSRVMTDDGWRVIDPHETTVDTGVAPTELGRTVTVDPSVREEDLPKLMQWERKLLDLGLRNQLINFRLTKNTLPILIPSLDELENALSEGIEYSIWDRPADLPLGEEGVTIETMHTCEAAAEMLQVEFQNRRLRSAYSSADTTRIMKELYRSAKTSMEENGANTLYITMGVLRWYENPRSKRARYAPLILIPIEILRKGAGHGYSIRLRDEEARINVTLLEKLKQDFEIDIAGLDPLPQDEHGTDTRRIMTVIRKAVMRQRGWDVLESAYIGIFSFSQFVMWNDIRNRAEDLKRNKIVRSLIDGRLAWDAREMEVGERVPEGGVYLPIPADASQLFAIEAACRGESFVLHGPPGTGKSQTITALIANCLAQGKTVLFVAEKMAALEVVQRRLEAIGIGDFCLELHSNKSKKKDVLEQLRRASEVNRHATSEQYALQATRIAALRANLDTYASALHRTLACGMTLFEVIDRYEAVAEAECIPLLSPETLAALTPERMEYLRALVDRVVAAGQLVGNTKDHPLSAVKRTNYHQNLRTEIADATRTYLEALEQFEAAATALGDAVGWEITTLSSLTTLLRIAEELKTWLSLPRAWAEQEDLSAFLSSVRTLARDRIDLSVMENGHVGFWRMIDSHKTKLSAESAECADALERMRTQTERLSNRIGIAVPTSYADYERLLEIANELMVWSAFPNAWARTDSPNLYFAQLIEMTQHYLDAKEIHDRYSELWKPSFWELDGEALLQGYRETAAKWALPRALGINKLRKSLSVHATAPIEKERLEEYLSALCTYRAELSGADALFEKYGASLDRYYSDGDFDWARIASDAEIARASLLRMRDGLDAGDALAAHAGSTRLNDPIGEFATSWETHSASAQRLMKRLCMDPTVAHSNWYASLSTLCTLIGEAEPRTLSMYLLLRLLSACAGAPARASLRLPATLVLAEKWVGEPLTEALGTTVVTEPLYSELGLTAATLDEYSRLFARYFFLRDESERLLETYGEAIPAPRAGGPMDWAGLLTTVGVAERSGAALDALGAGTRIRTSCAAESELAPLIHALLDESERFLPTHTAYSALLELEDTSTYADWIAENRAVAQAVLSNIDSVKEWLTWNGVKREAIEAGLDGLIEAYTSVLAHHEVLPAYQRSLYRSIAISEIDGDPVLNCFSGALFNEKVAQYKELDQRLTELTRQEIFCRLASQVPHFATEAARSSEVGILQKAIRSNGRALSIRKLFEQIPNLLPRLAPCMLMSPLSAAQYLDPKREPFDLVVFDEASQMPTCKAVGALARGENAVIVGDPKQMPPTSFFMSNSVDEDHIEDEDLESILDDCLSLNLPQTHLLWHYRSRHESLIAFSNSQFYENKLFTFPSVNDRETKVSMVRVDGTFDRGRTRQNRAEAEAIVAELCRRCHDPVLRGYSVGVVTFNVSQQNLIDDLLSDACAADAALERWVYESREPVFIKNLENVQGDERDVILFSIGYGPDAEDHVYMNFGPLNREGGWRRLNVAVSRARHEMIVFSSLDAERIDLSKTSSEGVAALKAFLEYASTHRLEDSEGERRTVRTYTDGIIDSICQRLSGYGYATATLVGRSEYRVDIAVIDPRDPDRYLLGILLDGAGYSAAKTARDREIGQICVLQGLGWNVLRVWTMDWWDNSSKEIARILEELTRLQSLSPAEHEHAAGAVGYLFGDGGEEEAAPTEELPTEEVSPYPVLEYRATVPEVRNLETDVLISGALDSDIVHRIRVILAGEAPISETLLTKRLLQGYGIVRAGMRLQAHLASVLGSMGLRKTEYEGQAFYWDDTTPPETLRSFRRNGDGINKREIRDVVIEEAINAVCRALNDQFSLLTGDLISEAASLLGFTRMGSVVEARMRGAIALAKERGRIVQATNGAWILPETE